MSSRIHFAFKTLPELEFDLVPGSAVHSWSLYYAGRKLKPVHGKIELHLADGSTEIIQVENRWDQSLTFIHGEERITPIPPITWDLVLFAAAPLIVAIIGGLPGAAIGGLGFCVNMFIAGWRKWGDMQRIVRMLIVTALCFALYFAYSAGVFDFLTASDITELPPEGA